MSGGPLCKGLAVIILVMFLSITDLVAMQDNPATEHEHHMADLSKHGAEAMGFDQDKTVHHFRLRQDGGVVQVQAKDPTDVVSIAQIQHHLGLQKEKFSLGDFGAPEHTHGQVPPGVPTMKKLKSQIRYEFRKTSQGGTLSISSSNPAAVEAIQQFLRFQIQEHKTGDPINVQ
ncbi:MAG TPA: hypothetical protein VEV41_17275 [Terriglobales bacterium]|jgi:hypothetical protein|nr:hypothetical protein [Terriglobales bacterium]